MTMLAASSRLLGSFAVVALVAGCGSRDTPVREVPQAVHPSPSALAQRTTNTPASQKVAPAPIYTSTANDGSNPIID
jgi:hypothetical protein